MVVLIFVAIVLPYRLAFYEEDTSKAWMIAWLLINFLFFLDIFVTFFTSITDKETNVEIFDHKKIAINYLKGWFFIDIISCVPFDLLAEGQ